MCPSQNSAIPETPVKLKKIKKSYKIIKWYLSLRIRKNVKVGVGKHYQELETKILPTIVKRDFFMNKGYFEKIKLIGNICLLFFLLGNNLYSQNIKLGLKIIFNIKTLYFLY